MKALVLEEKRKVALREIDAYQELKEDEVRIRMSHVGICGSDIHYYQHGEIGPFVVKEPMILGHEGSGVVIECGAQVHDLAVGDRVCIEPGYPKPFSKATLQGRYNLDPDIFFWATPPDHGCLCESVTHPGPFVHKLPEDVSLETGALVEPLAVGVFAAIKAKIKPMDSILITGAGTIGITTGMAALMAGAGSLIITDVDKSRLQIAKEILGSQTKVLDSRDDVAKKVLELTDGAGVDIAFEAAGADDILSTLLSSISPGGKLVLLGLPTKPASLDIATLISREVSPKSCIRKIQKK